MNASALEFAGMLVACGAAAIALLARDPRLRHGAMAIALIVAPMLVAGDVWDQRRFEDFRDSPESAAAAIAGAAAAVVAGAALFHRFPIAFPVAAFAVLPLRVPVELGGETSNLLIPLYFVIASGVVAAAAPTFLGWARKTPPLARRDRPAVRRVLMALAATLILYAIQTAYSEDVSNAIETAGFFLVPFAVLAALLLEVRWTSRLLGVVLAGVAVAAVLYGGFAIWQYAVRDLVLNDQLAESNELHLYFRVNSIFKDPNILGRNLALVIVAIGAWVAWRRDADCAAIAALVAAAVMLVALAFSFSVTSLVSLLAGLAAAAWLRWGRRWGAAIVATCAVAAVAIALIGADEGGLGSSGELDAATSGRAGLIEGGLDLAEARPVAGWGSGSFGRAFVSEVKPATTIISHAEPVTVAAEQGAIGLAVYVVLILTSVWVLLWRAGDSVARTAVGACYVAMLVHSIGYGGFSNDPATWALLGLGLALARVDPA